MDEMSVSGKSAPGATISAPSPDMDGAADTVADMDRAADTDINQAADDIKLPADMAMAADTEFTKVADGIYERVNDESWLGYPGLFGGYVNALALQACSLEVADPTRSPRTLTVHFLRRFPVGQMRVEANIERSGASVTVVTARMYCETTLCGFAAVTFAKERQSIDFTDLQMPQGIGFDPTLPLSGDLPFPFRDNLRMWDVFDGVPSGQTLSHSGGWSLPRHDQPIDERFLVAIADGFTPVAYRKLSAPMMAGTMEFTAYFRSNPKNVAAGEPVLAVLTTAASLHGYVEEDCNIWSQQGELLLQSRQLRFIQKAKTSMPELMS